MSGKPIYNISPDTLRVMYMNKSIPMDTIAERFGCSRRQLTEIIVRHRKLDPDKWPKRYLTMKERGEA